MPDAVPAVGGDQLEAGVDAHAVVRDSLPRPRRHLRRQLTGVPGMLVTADLAAAAVVFLLLHPAYRPALLFIGLLLTGRTVGRTYRPRITLSVLDDLPRLAGSTLAALGLSLGACAVAGAHQASVRGLVAYALSVFGTSLALAVLVLAASRARRRHSGRLDRTLIVGTGTVGRLLGDALLERPELGLSPVGYVEQGNNQVPRRDLSVPVVATRVQDLGDRIAEYDADTVVLAFDAMPESTAVDAIIAAHQRGASVLVVPHVLDLHGDGPDVDRVSGIPLLRLRPDPTLRFTWWIKRATDVVVTAFSLVVLAPLLGLLAVAVLIDSGRPVLFWQQRIGLDGRPFQLCKFRSMVSVPVDESQTTWSIAQDPRVTPIGRFLRASSLDEIPQLWNVLRGDMSLVGPRPERPTFVQRFSDEHERYWARHRVPVGLTGLAQVNGLRGDTSIADRARYDNYYIANWSLWLDLKIALLTAREMLRGSGA